MKTLPNNRQKTHLQFSSSATHQLTDSAVQQISRKGPQRISRKGRKAHFVIGDGKGDPQHGVTQKPRYREFTVNNEQYY